MANKGYSLSIEGSKTDGKGRSIERFDGTKLLKVLQFSYKDRYLNEGAGPFRPTLGFAFFKNGIVYGHLDVSLIDSKMELEIFDDRSRPFRYFWSYTEEHTKKH